MNYLYIIPADLCNDIQEQDLILEVLSTYSIIYYYVIYFYVITNQSCSI